MSEAWCEAIVGNGRGSRDPGSRRERVECAIKILRVSCRKCSLARVIIHVIIRVFPIAIGSYPSERSR